MVSMKQINPKTSLYLVDKNYWNCGNTSAKITKFTMSVMTSGIVIQMQASLRKLANDPQNREWMDKYIDNCIILEEIIEDLQKYRREGFVFFALLEAFLLDLSELIFSSDSKIFGK